MKRPYRLASRLAMTLGVAACGSDMTEPPPPPPQRVEVTAQETLFDYFPETGRVSAVLAVTVSTNAEVDVEWDICATQLERRLAEQWEPAWSPDCTDQSITLSGPGSAVTVPLRIEAAATDLSPSVGNELRIMTDITDGHEPLSLEERISNEFRVIWVWHLNDED